MLSARRLQHQVVAFGERGGREEQRDREAIAAVTPTRSRSRVVPLMLAVVEEIEIMQPMWHERHHRHKGQSIAARSLRPAAAIVLAANTRGDNDPEG